MPGPGELYNRVDIYLGKWLRDYTMKHRLNKSDMARRLRLNRGRMSQMESEQLNTIKYVQMCVERGEGGNYLAMMPYAHSKAAERWLQQQQLAKHLDEEREQTFDVVMSEVARLFLEGREQELHAAIKGLNGKPKK